MISVDNIDLLSYCFQKKYNNIPGYMKQSKNDYHLLKNEINEYITNYIFQQDYSRIHDELFDYAVSSVIDHLVNGSKQSFEGDILQNVINFIQQFKTYIKNQITAQQAQTIVRKYLDLYSKYSSVLTFAYNCITKIRKEIVCQEEQLILLFTFQLADTQSFIDQSYFLFQNTDNIFIKTFVMQLYLYIMQETSSKIQDDDEVKYLPICICKTRHRLEIPILSNFMNMKQLQQYKLYIQQNIQKDGTQLNDFILQNIVNTIIHEAQFSNNIVSYRNSEKILISDFRPNFQYNCLTNFYNQRLYEIIHKQFTESNINTYNLVELLNFITIYCQNLLNFVISINICNITPKRIKGQLNDGDIVNQQANTGNQLDDQQPEFFQCNNPCKNSQFVKDSLIMICNNDSSLFEFNVEGLILQPHNQEDLGEENWVSTLSYFLNALSLTDIVHLQKLLIPLESIQLFCKEVDMQEQQFLEFVKVQESTVFEITKVPCSTSLYGFFLAFYTMYPKNIFPSQMFGSMIAFLLHPTKKNFWIMINRLPIGLLFRSETHYRFTMNFKLLEYLYNSYQQLDDEFSLIKQLSILNYLGSKSHLYKQILLEKVVERKILDSIITIIRFPYTEQVYDLTLYKCLISEQFNDCQLNVNVLILLICRLNSDKQCVYYEKITQLVNLFLKNLILVYKRQFDQNATVQQQKSATQFLQTLTQQVFQSIFVNENKLRLFLQNQVLMSQQVLLKLTGSKNTTKITKNQQAELIIIQLLILQIVYSDFDFNAIINYFNFVQADIFQYFYLQNVFQYKIINTNQLPQQQKKVLGMKLGLLEDFIPNVKYQIIDKRWAEIEHDPKLNYDKDQSCIQLRQLLEQQIMQLNVQQQVQHIKK